jgi:hypothetical protein
VNKIAALKAIKIVWPADNFGDDIWCVSVDGVDCPTVEPVHERYPKDDKKFSKKSNSSGLKYELGISLVTSDLVTGVSIKASTTRRRSSLLNQSKATEQALACHATE